MKKIGFFGGTFDPIHFGHLNLAIELFEAHKLDEVWFCPACINPHRDIEPISSENRLTMVQKAIEDIPHFKVIDIECQKEGPSYTVDTLKALSKENHKLFLLLGQDALATFHKWKNPEEIISLATPLVGRRMSERVDEVHLHCPKPIAEALKKGFTPIHCLDISSTDIRERLQKNLYCGHLVPSKVLDFIYQNRLY